MQRSVYAGGGTAIGVLTVSFYGPNAHSLSWQPAAGGESMPAADLLAEVVALFYAQQLFNLGQGPVAEGLLTDVARAVQLQLLAVQAGTPAPRVLASDVATVPPQSGAIQQYTAVVTEAREGYRRLQVSGDRAAAATYAPLAVKAVLEWALNQVAPDGRAYVLATLHALHRYYREQGTYNRLQSATAGPRYAVTEVRLAGDQVTHGGRTGSAAEPR